MPSVIAMTSSMPASSASRIESAAKRGGTKIIAVFAPVSRHRVVEGVEDRDALDVLAALARRHAGDDLRAVVRLLQRVERALAAGDAGDAELRVSRRRGSPSCRPAPRLARRRRASSPRRARWAGPPRPAGARPSSSLVPSRRTTNGTVGLIWSNASIRPLATSSQRVMPPKMLNSTALTFASERITSTALRDRLGLRAAAGVEEVRRARRRPGRRRRASTSRARRRCRGCRCCRRA